MNINFGEIVDQKVSELYYVGKRLNQLDPEVWSDKFNFLKKEEHKEYIYILYILKVGDSYYSIFNLKEPKCWSGYYGLVKLTHLNSTFGMRQDDCVKDQTFHTANNQGRIITKQVYLDNLNVFLIPGVFEIMKIDNKRVVFQTTDTFDAVHLSPTFGIIQKST